VGGPGVLGQPDDVGERERVAMMSGMYAAWAARCEVRDWPLD